MLPLIMPDMALRRAQMAKLPFLHRAECPLGRPWSLLKFFWQTPQFEYLLIDLTSIVLLDLSSSIQTGGPPFQAFQASSR